MRVSMIMCDKVYIEIDGSTERLDLDHTEIQKMIEVCSIPTESISCTMHVEKNSPNYKRMRKFFKKLFNEANKNENWWIVDYLA